MQNNDKKHMIESVLLQSIATRAAGMSQRFPRVLEGPGDDCAVVSFAGGAMLLTVDQLVEGRHVRPGTAIDLIARKAIARSISDIAAMAGTPVAALATGTLPAGFDSERADQLCARLHHWAERWGCPVVGGDIASSGSPRDPMVLTVTVVGEPHVRRGPVLRRTARVGDSVFVTGRLGGSFEPATGLGRHLTFTPRVTSAAALVDALGTGLHAMMDISDGLGRDAGRLARASGVTIELEAGDLPCTPGVDWPAALRDGEDYELLFTAASAPASLPDGDGGQLAVTRIGRVVAARPGNWCLVRGDGREFEASEEGWDHA